MGIPTSELAYTWGASLGGGCERRVSHLVRFHQKLWLLWTTELTVKRALFKTV